MVITRPTFEVEAVDSAFEAVEDHLREAGFFGDAPPRGLCADVYLGYGLSEPLRRSGETEVW